MIFMPETTVQTGLGEGLELPKTTVEDSSSEDRKSFGQLCKTLGRWRYWVAVNGSQGTGTKLFFFFFLLHWT
jgi:hypothetical protein